MSIRDLLKFILKEELFTLQPKTFIGKVDHFGSTLWHKHTNFLFLSYEIPVLHTHYLCALIQTHGHDPASDMAAAAKRFIKSLDPSAKKIAHFAFKSAERENWHFFPGPFIRPDGRLGLSLKDMSPAQKILAHGLMGSALSHRGLLETTDVILLEQILYEREEREMRNPELYHVSIFGEPDKAGTWGWRFEGHHLSLNFTFVNGRIFSITPSFYGASPARVKRG